MVFIRPVSIDDLDQLVGLAGLAGTGLTTLPRDRDLLRKRILKSQRSIESIPDRPGGESYLLVLVDEQTGRVVGASGIVSKVGGFEPFYAYRIEKVLHQSDELKVRKEVPVLNLVREHNGPCEIGSLFLAPEYRRKDNGRLLQLVRFLFMAEHPDAFEPLVVSEMRGVIDDVGHSAFWDAVGRHFFDIDFREADRLSVVNKKFIADLMPTLPIYIPLLPHSAQAVIGQVHEESRPALKNLEAEGFRFSGMVDIFDAGPCISCARDEIRSVRESRVATVERIIGAGPAGETYMICTTRPDFLACCGTVEKSGEDAVRVGADVARVLKIAAGERVRFSPLRPAAAEAGGQAARPQGGGP